MQPYMSTLAKSPEYKKIHFVRVDMEALPVRAACRLQTSHHLCWFAQNPVWQSGTHLASGTVKATLHNQLLALLEANLHPRGPLG
jgi:hypothetical protein